MGPRSELKCTLLADGSSDKVLVPILDWAIRQHLANIPSLVIFGDLRKLPNPPRSLKDRMQAVLKYYPCDIMFVHRDAERDTIEARENEIAEACQNLENITFRKDAVAVIPVRMTEAWLLFDEDSIKVAAGNPNNNSSLLLPSPQQAERLSNPKAVLYEKIREASALQGRKLAKLKIPQRVHVLVDNIEDFSPLRQLSAFQKLETDIKETLTNL